MRIIRSNQIKKKRKNVFIFFFQLSSTRYLIDYCLIVECASNNAIKIISNYVLDLHTHTHARALTIRLNQSITFM